MDEILLKIDACQKPDHDQQLINSILLHLQTNLNRVFLGNFSEEDLIKLLVKIRDFILMAASNSISSVRISAYRTVCMILMKTAPFYPTILQKVFIESINDSEINEKNSQIIIASFTFLSKFIAPPLLQIFISQTSYIFKYFTAVDSSYSDHLAPIVRNLGHLGNLWLKQLLLSFLEKGVKSTDRHIILAISEILKHDPIYFFKELIFYLTNHKQIKENFALLSFLFTTIQCNYQSLDFAEILKESIEILSNIKSSTANEIDSVLQILSLDSPPFKITISLPKDKQNHIEQNSSIQNNENHLQQNIEIESTQINESNNKNDAAQNDQINSTNENTPTNNEINSNDENESTINNQINSTNEDESSSSNEINSNNESSTTNNEINSNDKNNENCILDVYIDAVNYDFHFTLDTTELISHPSFYLLPLPISFLDPLPTDGILQLSSKFKTLSKIANKFCTTDKTKLLILNKFEKFLSQSYNDMTSACITNFASSIGSFLQLNQQYKVMNLIREIIFAKPASWFHSYDIVSVINEIPYSYFDIMNNKDHLSIPKQNKFDLKRILDLLIMFSANSNEKLAQSSKQLIAKLVSNTDFIPCLYYISEKVDYFDLDSLLNYLSIFINIFDYRKQGKSLFSLRKELYEFHTMIFPLIESRSFFHDPKLSVEIIHYLSYFDLLFLKENVILAKLFCDCESIISSSMNCTCGSNILIKPLIFTEIQFGSFIQNEISNCNYEEVPEYGIDYSRYMPSFSIALQFIYNYPHVLLKQSKVFDVFNYSIHFFPSFAANFTYKNWKLNFDSKMKLKILSYARPHLPHIQDRKMLAIFCKLFLSFENCLPKDMSSAKIKKIKVTIHDLTSKMLDPVNFFPEYFALEVFVNDNIDHLCIENLNHDQQLELFRLLLSYDNLKLLEKVGDSKFYKIENEIPSELASRQQRIENLMRKGMSSLLKVKTPLTKDTKNDLKLTDIVNSPMTIISPNDLNSSNINSSALTETQTEPSATTNLDDIKISESLYDIVFNEILPKGHENDLSDEHALNNISLMHRSSSADIALKLMHKTVGNNGSATESLLSRIDTTTDTEFDEKSVCLDSLLKFDVSKEMLYENLVDSDLSNDLIKTQLKMNLFDFAVEQIHKLIRFYIEHNDLDGLKLIFQFLKKKHIDIKVLNYEFPIQLIKDVYDYLLSINSDELTEFMNQNSNIFEFQLNQSMLLNTHLTKQQLIELSHFLCKFDLDTLIQFLIKELKAIKKKNRLNILLLLANIICSFGTIDPEKINEIISLICSKQGILTHHLFSQLIMTISLHLNKDNDNEFLAKFIRHSYPQFQGRLSGLLVLHRALLAIPGIKKHENVSYFAAFYLTSDIPSMFCSGLRFFYQGLNTLNEDDIIQLIKTEIPKIMETFNSHKNIFPVCEISSEIFSYLLSNDLHYSDLMKYINDLIPQNDLAISDSLSVCLPLLISRYPNNQDKIWKRLEDTSDSLITKPMNLSMFKIYLQCLKVRHSKVVNARIKDTFITDFVASWMQNLKYFDCYDMSEIFYEWEKLIYSDLGIEQLGPFVCYQFFKYIPRFFPLFVSMTKFFNEILEKEGKDVIEMFLKNSALMKPIKAHALSTVLALNKEYINEALQLASFYDDCDDSNKIIQSNHVFQELLNDIYGTQ